MLLTAQVNQFAIPRHGCLAGCMTSPSNYPHAALSEPKQS